MSRICQLTGKRPQVGNRVSHANNKTKRWFLPNLHTQRFFLPTEKRWVTLKVCSSAVRTINKYGIEQAIRKAKKKGTFTGDLSFT